MTLFTGPNNSGKSLLLRELLTLLSNYPGRFEPRHWVRGIEIYKEGSGQEFISWLNGRGYGARLNRARGQHVLPAHPDGEESGLEVSEAMREWEASRLSSISYLLVKKFWTETRLGNQTDSAYWDQTNPPSHPTQRLWESKDLQARFSALFEQAFGEAIAINRYVPSIRLQVGDPGQEDCPPPAPPSLREAYESLPFLNQQGDGVRAFSNILLHSFVSPVPIIVIDEPEAFLHPPQARLLGRYLALHIPSPCQIFVATHSADFLSGVLEGKTATSSPARPLVLVRMSRAGRTSAARTLDAETVTEILDTPLLRYSNIVSGLFHDGVVLSESEGDCQFYAATFDVVHADGRHKNLTYLHVNGKARLTEAAQKLRTCGIPVAVVTDFDFLNDVSNIKKALRHLGGRWEEVKDDVLNLQAYVQSSVVTRPAVIIKDNITRIIGSVSGNVLLSQRQIDEIASELRLANGWKTLKLGGLNALSGDPYNAALRLVEYFQNLGLFIVPVGELECWVREVPGANKKAWLTQVFDGGSYKSPSLELRTFVIRISDYLTSPT
nr:AAA family ATPase [Streptomyces sp. 549]